MLALQKRFESLIIICCTLVTTCCWVKAVVSVSSIGMGELGLTGSFEGLRHEQPPTNQ